MAVLPILTAPDPRLKLVSEPVETVDTATRKLLDDMIETMYEAPGIGLAAVQVGVARRLLVLDVSGEDDARTPLCFINPELVWASDEYATYNEGCLSVPEHYAEVDRPARVRVRYLDHDGVAREVEADGLLATCLQHEMDHLDGVLFIEHLSRLRRDMILRKLRRSQRLSQPA